MINAFMCFLVDVFGLTASRSIGALRHLALGRRSTQQVQTNRVKCDVVSVSIVLRPGTRLGRWPVCFSGHYRMYDNALLGLWCAAKERLATARCGDVKKQSRLGEL